MTRHDDALGPVNYAVVEFAGGTVTPGGLREVAALVDAGTIAVLDLEFLSVTGPGTVERLDGAAVGIDLAGFTTADSGLLGDDDRAEIARDATPGSTVAVIVYENRSFTPALAAWEHEGARVLAEGPVDPDDLLAALGPDEG